MCSEVGYYRVYKSQTNHIFSGLKINDNWLWGSIKPSNYTSRFTLPTGKQITHSELKNKNLLARFYYYILYLIAKGYRSFSFGSYHWYWALAETYTGLDFRHFSKWTPVVVALSWCAHRVQWVFKTKFIYDDFWKNIGSLVHVVVLLLLQLFCLKKLW